MRAYRRGEPAVTQEPPQEQSVPSRPELPFCQSCAMPFATLDDFGTDSDGSRSREYCALCYEQGAFKGDFTLQEMVQISALGMAEAMGTPEETAREMLAGILPNLKRWRGM